MWLTTWLRDRRSNHARQRVGQRRRPVRVRPWMEVLEDRTVPSQISLTVGSLADSGAGSLRAAIQTADAGSHSDQFTINFSVNGTIDLQSPLPDLNNSIAIQGPGASSLTVERAAGASFASAIVTVDAGQTASLSGLTIANGNAIAIAFGHAGGIDNNGTLTVANSAVVNNSSNSFNSFGGGIYNAGTLTVSASTLSGNSASVGGGIYNAGTATIQGITLSGNSAPFGGGGIESFGTAKVSNCTLSGNTGGGIRNDRPGTLSVSSCTLSANSGGGIDNIGTATIQDCTLSGNSSIIGINGDIGGGIFNGGALTVTNSTLSGNSAADGGGIANFGGMLTVSGCTLSGNSATNFGGGIYNSTDVFSPSSSVTVRDSTLTDNSAAEGGGIYNDASALLAVRGTTFSGNSASDSGGGIYNLGTATVQQCSLSRSSAGSDGGGIFNGASGTLTVKDSTVLNNTAPLGSDIYNLGVLTLNDSTVGVIGP